MAAPSSRNSQPHSLPYAPVDGLELPKDEKELIASLHLLQDKLAQMERERADSDQKTYEYEQEIIQLRSEMEQQRNIRRSDSALGSSDGEGNGKVTARTKLQIEKTRKFNRHHHLCTSLTSIGLEASVQTLQQQLDSAERKFTVAETNAKRVTKERDSLVTQLGVAFYSSEELKNDVNFLEKENQTLRESIDDRDAIIRDLRIQLNHTQELHQEATQTLTKKEAEINLQTANDASIVAENATLRQKLANLAAKEEENRRRVRQEAETARITARAEQEAMKAENDQLLAELKLSKAKREAEMKRWAVKEVQLKATIDCRDGTVQNPNGISQQNNSNAVHRSKSKHSNAGQANNAVDLNMDGKRRVSTGTSLGQEAKILRSESKSSRQSRRVSAPPSSKSVEQPSNEYSTMLEFSSLSYDRVRGEVEKEHVSRTNGQAVSAAPKAILGDDTMAAIRRNVEKEHFARVNGRPTSPDSVLSAFSPGRIRRQIQAEYLAANPLRPASLDSVLDDASVSLHQSTGKDLTTHSIASSTGSRRSAHARASSADGSLAREKPDQDFTGRSRASSTGQTSQDADIHSIGSKQDTQQSIRSLTGTRPRARGVPTEMTSAFIIPDITLNIPNVLNTTLSTSAHAVLDKLAPHDSQNCAVCYRIASKLDSKLENFAIPVPIPVSTLNEQEGDADVTFRPADAPHKALSRVIKELADEIVHLKHSLHKTERRLNIHDPARGSRDRRALHSAIDSLNRSIAAKSSQLYDLYDVLESHKDELTTHAGPAAAREIEEDFSNMTEDVEKILAELAAERHATIQSPPRPAVAQDQIDSESELPWNGISPTDTESFSKMFDLHL
jgi:hypothetical protein